LLARIYECSLSPALPLHPSRTVLVRRVLGGVDERRHVRRVPGGVRQPRRGLPWLERSLQPIDDGAAAAAILAPQRAQVLEQLLELPPLLYRHLKLVRIGPHGRQQAPVELDVGGYEPVGQEKPRRNARAEALREDGEDALVTPEVFAAERPLHGILEADEAAALPVSPAQDLQRRGRERSRYRLPQGLDIRMRPRRPLAPATYPRRWRRQEPVSGD